MTIETIKKFNGGCMNCDFQTDNREALEAHKCAVLCNACGQFAESSELDRDNFHKPVNCDAFELSSIFIEGRLWFDKVNGNTYFSNRIWINGKVVYEMPMEYGYDLQHVHRAIEHLQERGYFAGEKVPQLWQIREEMNVDIYYSSTYGKKSELFTGGK
jgi:hypothetical protein